MWKIIKWPVFYVVMQLGLIFILAFIYVGIGNDINLFSQFLNKNQIFVTLALSIIFVPLLINLYKKLNKKENEVKYLFLIISGIILSLIYNVFAFYMNDFFHISNLYSNSPKILTTLIATGILGPIIEELMFRGIIYNNLKEKYSNMKSILITTIIFSLMHPNVLQMLFALAIGFILIYVYEKYQSIKAPIILHMASNITTTLFMPILIQNNFIINYLVFIISLSILFIIYRKEVRK